MQASGRITKTKVERLAYGGSIEGEKATREILWDSELRGFGVRVFPSGTKSYVLSYRHFGRKHLFTIGRVGVMSLDEARRLARARLVSLAQGSIHFVSRQKWPRDDALSIERIPMFRA